MSLPHSHVQIRINRFLCSSHYILLFSGVWHEGVVTCVRDDGKCDVKYRNGSFAMHVDPKLLKLNENAVQPIADASNGNNGASHKQASVKSSIKANTSSHE